MTRARAPVASERAEQAALFAWLQTAAPPGLWATCIPGGDGRATRAPGFCAGAPDVLLIWQGKAILVEMKRRRGWVLSSAQRAAHAAITGAGGIVILAAGWADAAAHLRRLVPMRSRVAA